MVAAAREPGKVVRIFAPDAAATAALGACVAAFCEPGARVYLDGELGTGKTTFARGFLQALGHAGNVRSPSYTLVESYHTARGRVFHFDLYRIKDPLELEAMGFRDYFDGTALCLVEWSRRARSLLGRPDLQVLMEHRGTGRDIVLEAGTPAGVRWLKGLASGTSLDPHFSST